MKPRHLMSCIAAIGMAMTAHGAYPELLWDMERIHDMAGGAKLTLHHPEFKEVVLVHDAPWEGNVCGYYTVLHDGKTYRMYYRGANWPIDMSREEAEKQYHEVTCYAESDDGIHWTKPSLGLWEFNGSKENNIILMNDSAAHNFTPCFDSNPACPPEQRFKALGGWGGLWLFVSADGIHWTKAQEEPVLTNGAFDSQNTLFYDGVNKHYVANSRFFRHNENGEEVRAIQRNLSADAIHWSEPEPLDYGPVLPNIELYTNAIHPYVNNPAVYIGLPKRYNGTRTSHYDQSGGKGVSDGVFMSSRDGLHYHRWDDAFIRPGRQHERWVNRNNMNAQGVVLTQSDLDGTDPVLTLYSSEAYYGPGPSRLRRLILRQDGFVSVQAPLTGGSFTMKPMEVARTTGDTPKEKPTDAAVWGKLMLLLNASTSCMGEIRCEIRDEQNTPIPGFTLADSVPAFGDELDLPMAWQNGAELTSLAGRTVILHFELKDADIYSLRFGQPRNQLGIRN